MTRLFRAWPEAIDNNVHFFSRLQFSLDELSHQYPDEIFDGESPALALRRLTYEGARKRYPDEIPRKVLGLLDYELKLIAEKRAQYESKLGQSNAVEPADNGQFPEGAKLCTKCNTKAMIIMDNCLTCLNCGDSKCG